MDEVRCNVVTHLHCSAGGLPTLATGQVGSSLALLDAGQLCAKFRQHRMLRRLYISAGAVIPSQLVAAPSRCQDRMQQVQSNHLWK